MQHRICPAKIALLQPNFTPASETTPIALFSEGSRLRARRLIGPTQSFLDHGI
jgi:hypothetical protein